MGFPLTAPKAILHDQRFLLPIEDLVISLRSALLLAALILPSTLDAQAATARGGRPLPLKRRPQPTTTAITENDLMSRLYLFADDSMMGREAGSIGAMKGTAYIAAEARRLGLKPAGDSGSYFQSVPFIARTLDPQSTLTVNDATLIAYKDFVILPFRGAQPRAVEGTQVIYGGVTGDTAHALTAEQAAGKFVVLRAAPGVAFRVTATHPLAGAAAVAVAGAVELSAATLATGRSPSLTLPPAPGAPSALLTMSVTQSAAERLLGAPLEGLSVGATGGTVQGTLERSLHRSTRRADAESLERGAEEALGRALGHAHRQKRRRCTGRRRQGERGRTPGGERRGRQLGRSRDRHRGGAGQWMRRRDAERDARCGTQHHELSRRLLGGQCVRRVSGHATIDHLGALDRARLRATERKDHEILVRDQRGVVHRQRRLRVERARDERNVLEVATAVACRLEAEASSFGGDVRRSLHRSGRPRLAPHHRVVGEQIKPRHQVVLRDRRRRRLWPPFQRERTSATRGRGLRVERGGDDQGSEQERGAKGDHKFLDREKERLIMEYRLGHGERESHRPDRQWVAYLHGDLPPPLLPLRACASRRSPSVPATPSTRRPAPSRLPSTSARRSSASATADIGRGTSTRGRPTRRVNRSRQRSPRWKGARPRSPLPRGSPRRTPSFRRSRRATTSSFLQTPTTARCVWCARCSRRGASPQTRAT